MYKIKLGTRGSKLAITQAEYVRDAILLKVNAAVEIDIVPIVTAGDLIANGSSTIDVVGGIKGLFTKEIDSQLLSGNIDIAVHSVKDMSSEVNTTILLAAVLPREDSSDAFVSNISSDLANMPHASVLGTSSIRRSLFIKAFRPDIKIVNFRGNVLTRFAKLDKGCVDATVMAVSGIRRLQKMNRISAIIDKSIILPAAGQGAIAAVALSNRRDIIEMLDQINCTRSYEEIMCERAFANAFGADCYTPIAALASVNGAKINLESAFLQERPLRIIRDVRSGNIDDAKIIAHEAATYITTKLHAAK